jgi:hypothetical protein
MAQYDSPEGLAKKWFVLAAMGAMIYFSVVFSYVIRGNDSLLDEPAGAKVEHHD